jgi:hypothetical protein
VSCGAGVLTFLVSLGALNAQTLSQGSQPQPVQQAAAPPGRVFASDAGLILNFIKPDKTAAFEAVVAKLRQALKQSEKPERLRQAGSWKVFRALEPGADGSVLYVFVMDPVVKGADYAVAALLAEAFPRDVQALYEQYAGAYATGQKVVSLTTISALGQTVPSAK